MTQPGAPAGLVRRCAAGVYDLFLLVGLWFVAALLLLPFNHGQAVDGHNAVVRLYFFFVPYLFFSYFWVRGGQTLGMKAWRIQLRGADDGAVAWHLTPIRYITAWIAWCSVVGMFWCLIDRQRRAPQDIASRSKVVMRP